MATTRNGARARAGANFALVKYWGKADARLNVPAVGSISITLDSLFTETEVELADGQTFAIAGLMNNTVTDTMRKIPGIGDIPILGWLFKARSNDDQSSELVVFITPTLLRTPGGTRTSSAPPVR